MQRPQELSGVLGTKVRNGLYSTYANRYFELNGTNGLLFYYKSQAVKDQPPLGCIDLRLVLAIEDTKGNHTKQVRGRRATANTTVFCENPRSSEPQRREFTVLGWFTVFEAFASLSLVHPYSPPQPPPHLPTSSLHLTIPRHRPRRTSSTWTWGRTISSSRARTRRTPGSGKKA